VGCRFQRRREGSKERDSERPKETKGGHSEAWEHGEGGKGGGARRGGERRGGKGPRYQLANTARAPKSSGRSELFSSGGGECRFCMLVLCGECRFCMLVLCGECRFCMD
jgi:hypothetical protein